MRVIRKRVLAVLLSMVMALTMLVALPTAAHAAQTIDLATLTADASGGTAGDDSWEYIHSDRMLTLNDAGPYTLEGTNTNLGILVASGAGNATVILNNVSIATTSSAPAPCLDIYRDCTITLIGTSLFNAYSSYGLRIRPDVNCTINGAGSLSITAQRPAYVASGIFVSSNATLSVYDTAIVSAESTSTSIGYGIQALGAFASGSATINVASGATLNAKGMSGIASGENNTAFILNVNGALNVEATDHIAFHSSGGGYDLGGNGTITITGATGKQVFYVSTYTIKMDDIITLVVNSGDTDAQTVSFTKSSTVNTYQWKLTNATFVSPSVATDATVSISIPVGASTITRELRPVCEIVGGAQYTTIDAALPVVANGQTIRLLTDVKLTTALIIDNSKTFTFDTNGKTLDFDDKGLAISDSSEVSFIGCSKFVDLGWISVFDDGTRAEFDGGLMLTAGSLFAEDDVVVVVNGNLDSQNSDGVIACNGATVAVEGYVYAAAGGVYADSGAKVSVGDITAGGDGVYADGATVTVIGNIDADGDGVYAEGGAKVIVTGDITARDDDGVSAWDEGTEVTVNGSIEGPFGVYAGVGAKVTVTGDIDAENVGVLVGGVGTVINVGGNITAGYAGVSAWEGAVVFVVGNILVTDVLDEDDDWYNCGVFVADGAEVTVDGTITAPNYVGFLIPGANPDAGDIWFYYLSAAQNTTPSELDGYKQYDDEGKYDMFGSYVWVKDTTTTVPGTGDGTALALLLGALMVAALGTGLVFAYRRRRQDVE